MDTQKILKKRDKKHKKDKKEKKTKHYSSEPSDEGENVPVEQQINNEESSDDAGHEDQRDAVDIKKISIVAEPGHSAAEADAKAESKFLK